MTNVSAETPLPVVRPTDLPLGPADGRWLVEGLWTDQGVGVIGGAPKTLKTWLALEMAVSVATGTACLRRFAVHRQGRVLLYAAEDCASALRERIDSIALAHCKLITELDIGIIDTPRLLLDHNKMRLQLHATLKTEKPLLLILDPVVRMHRGDENSSKDVAAILGYLRALQRHHNVAIALVHHTRKSPASAQGHELRGSGDFFAWGDCFLYMNRYNGVYRLTVQHRSAPAIDPVVIDLRGDPPRLETLDDHRDWSNMDLMEALSSILSCAKAPMTTRQLQRETRVRTGRVLSALHEMSDRKLVTRSAGGWVHRSFPVSHDADHRERQRSDQLPLPTKL